MTPSGGGKAGLFLRNSHDIERVKRQGRRISTPLFNLLACRMDDVSGRVGIITGRRFGPAVRRNRAKRRFRELTRRIAGRLASQQVLLVFPKRESLSQPFAALEQSWESTLIRHRLIGPAEGNSP